MIEYKQSTQVLAPVRLLDDTGETISNKTFSDVTVTLLKSDGTQVIKSVGISDWTELTTGSFVGSGTYTLVLNTTDTNTTGVLLYLVRASGSADYCGAVKIVANEEADTYALMLQSIGLLHQNSVVDFTTYNSVGMLTGARLRAYDSKSNAQAAGSTGLRATYTVTATYAGASLQMYSVVLEP